MTADQVEISVVMPVFNEAATITQAIARVLDCGFQSEVIVVDDGSTDGTREILKDCREPRVRCFFHAVNRGKGAALRVGFAAARSPIVVVQDGDLEYDPQDYRNLLRPLIDGRADMVYGSRFLGGPHRVLYFWHYLINQALTTFANALCNLNLNDMETGMKAFSRDRLSALTLTANRFTFEPEVTVKAARAGWRVYEVPISYSGRTYAEGKKIGWRDGVATVAALLYYRFFD